MDLNAGKNRIMTHRSLSGAIMDLNAGRRGVSQGYGYIEETRAVLHYQLPLEIIYDFFDALIKDQRGYASFDYEMAGYVKSELVKLDILINKEESMHCHLIIHTECTPTNAEKRKMFLS